MYVITTAKISGILSDLLRFFYRNVFCFICLQSKKDKNRKKKDTDVENSYDQFDKNDAVNNQVTIVDDNEDFEDEDTEENLSVPLFIVLGVLAGYLALGGYIFSQVETWDIIQSSYFSFVSLSTMGKLILKNKIKL